MGFVFYMLINVFLQKVFILFILQPRKWFCRILYWFIKRLGTTACTILILLLEMQQKDDVLLLSVSFVLMFVCHFVSYFVSFFVWMSICLSLCLSFRLCATVLLFIPYNFTCQRFKPIFIFWDQTNNITPKIPSNCY